MSRGRVVMVTCIRCRAEFPVMWDPSALCPICYGEDDPNSGGSPGPAEDTTLEDPGV